MKAKFIGEPGTDDDVPKVFEAYGVEFHRGKFADVSDDIGRKLAGNSHFEVEGEEPKDRRETIPELKDRVQTISDLDILQQELQGETRDGGRKVLQDRIDDLLA